MNAETDKNEGRYAIISGYPGWPFVATVSMNSVRYLGQTPRWRRQYVTRMEYAPDGTFGRRRGTVTT